MKNLAEDKELIHFVFCIIFHAFCCLLIFFKINFSKFVSNSLDPDQAQGFVGPDLGPNCLQRLSAEDTS